MRHVLKRLMIISMCMALFLGGLLFYSYQTSKQADLETLEQNISQNESPIQTKKGRVDEKSSNLIFYTSKDGKELKEVVVEVLDGKQGRLSFISIPIDTIVDVDASLYQKLSAVDTEMPQHFILFRLESMFEPKRRYSYGQLLMDELLGIDSSYYTVIRGEEASFAEYRKRIQQSYPLETEAEIMKAIQSCIKDVRSNLTKKKRKRYAKFYAMVHKDQVQELTVEGIQHNAGFELDVQKFRMLSWESGIK